MQPEVNFEALYRAAFFSLAQLVDLIKDGDHADALLEGSSLKIEMEENLYTHGKLTKKEEV